MDQSVIHPRQNPYENVKYSILRVRIPFHSSYLTPTQMMSPTPLICGRFKGVGKEEEKKKEYVQRISYTTQPVSGYN
jgi:hypothetical protein